MKRILTLLLLCLTSSVFAQKTIVLVHGAWAFSAVWQDIVPPLKAKGYEVITVNLPGHGDDATPFKRLTLKAYTNAVEKAIGNRTNVVLLGHSMGGIVISQVAEDIPGKIAKLIYLTAFVPNNGDSFISISRKGPETGISQYLSTDLKSERLIVSAGGVMNNLMEDAPQPLKEYAAKNIKPEPLTPLSNPVKLSSKRFGKLKKSFIFVVNDKAIAYTYQKKMANAAGITETDSLRSGHCPMFSQPAQLAVLIDKQAR